MKLISINGCDITLSIIIIDEGISIAEFFSFEEKNLFV